MTNIASVRASAEQIRNQKRVIHREADISQQRGFEIRQLPSGKYLVIVGERDENGTHGVTIEADTEWGAYAMAGVLMSQTKIR